MASEVMLTTLCMCCLSVRTMKCCTVGSFGPQLGYEAGQIQVEHQDRVLCMVDDVLQVCQEEPRVQGVTHRPQSHDAIPAQWAAACHILFAAPVSDSDLRPCYMGASRAFLLVHVSQ